VMGKNSAIAWTTHTFNPLWGCVKLPERRECDHCYAAAFANRTGHHVWGKTAPRRLFGAEHWHEPFKWDAAATKAGRVDSVFCGSMCDVFEDHPDVASQRPKLWDLIRRTPSLRWLLLTKRPGNVPSMLPDDLYLDNPRVLVGATVGTAAAARYPVPVDFISAEPLLEEVDITRWFAGLNRAPRTVIIGAESSGKNPGRPCNLEWVRSLVFQANTFHAAVFVKQLHINGRLSHDPAEWPEDLRIRELGWTV
jgi:protein gp37